MPISVTCQCGRRITAKDELSGKRVACPSCKQPLLIAAAGGGKASPVRKAPSPVSSSNSASAANSVTVTCKCGQKLKAASHLFGKMVTCPKCRSPLSIPNGPETPVLAEPVDDPLGLGSLNTFPQTGGADNDPLGIGSLNTLPQTMPTAGSYGNYGTLAASAPAPAPAKKKSSGTSGKFWTLTGSGVGTVVILLLVLLRIGGTVAKAMRRAGVFNGSVKAEWVPYTSQSGGYAVEIVKQTPGVSIPGLAGNVGAHGIVAAMSPAGPCTVVNAEQLPTSLTDEQVGLALTAWQTQIQGMMGGFGGQLVQSGACTVAGNPGQEMTVEVLEDGTTSVVHFRASFKGNWAYTLVYLATKPVYKAEDAQRFFASFRLIGGAPNASPPPST